MISNQYSIFLIFIAVGILIGLLFDLFRILRKSYKTPDIITYMEDICFWLISGIILLYSIFVFNGGNIRAYIFIALFFGILIYSLMISKYFLKYGTKLFNIINKLIGIIIVPIIRLLRKVIKTLISIIKTLSKKIIKIEKKKKIA